MSARIHRHASLMARRRKLTSLSPRHVRSISALLSSIKARLIFATVHRAMQMDALGCCPAGLEIVAFKDLVQDRKYMSRNSLVQCQMSVPKAMLMPLLDELLCSYDNFRGSLWPVQDSVLADMNRSGEHDWSASQDNPVRRAAHARIALPEFMISMQDVMVSSILQQLRPDMLLDWTLHVTDTEVLPLGYACRQSQSCRSVTQGRELTGLC